jgi:hypothetical protein
MKDYRDENKMKDYRDELDKKNRKNNQKRAYLKLMKRGLNSSLRRKRNAIDLEYKNEEFCS